MAAATARQSGSVSVARGLPLAGAATPVHEGPLQQSRRAHPGPSSSGVRLRLEPGLRRAHGRPSPATTWLLPARRRALAGPNPQCIGSKRPDCSLPGSGSLPVRQSPSLPDRSSWPRDLRPAAGPESAPGWSWPQPGPDRCVGAGGLPAAAPPSPRHDRGRWRLSPWPPASRHQPGPGSR